MDERPVVPEQDSFAMVDQLEQYDYHGDYHPPFEPDAAGALPRDFWPPTAYPALVIELTLYRRKRIALWISPVGIVAMVFAAYFRQMFLLGFLIGINSLGFAIMYDVGVLQHQAGMTRLACWRIGRSRPRPIIAT